MCIVCVFIYRLLLRGTTTDMFFFLRFLLTGFKICTFRSEEHNNRAKGKGKKGYYFHRYHFHTITVAIKFGFEQYTNKK